MEPESVSIAIAAEVEFTVHRDGTFGRARVFTSSLSPAFDETLLHSVSMLDSAHALPALPATIRDDSLVLLFTARDARDSTGVQGPLFHATMPIWITDRSAFPRRRNPIPLYPANAERAHVGDDLLYAFVVDATGVPRMDTLRLLRGKYQNFQRAILAVLPEWRFFPATISGCPVAQAVQMPFTFRVDY
jgi:TonB family protein